MNIRPHIRNLIIEIICLLFVLLFVYAATSKLMDFQKFKIELGQSPLLSAFAEWFAVLVPTAEFIICTLLIIPKFRIIGLISAYGLMVMFTAYIFIILNYTSFVPCSCGGVLEKLDWKSHMIFNLVFVFLGFLGILLYNRSTKMNSSLMKNKSLVVILSTVTISGIGIVSTLFMLSENIVHYHNRLIRRFPQHPILKTIDLDLKMNSYYIAGLDNSHIYLGNYSAQLSMMVLDSKLVQTKEKMIDIDRKDIPFRGVKILVQPPYFFVVDGTVPCIFRGQVYDWKARMIHQGGEYFGNALAIDSSKIAVSTTSKLNGDTVLGLIEMGETNKTILNPDILQKQVDGVFDTDGQLAYSSHMKNIIYLYTYRNEFTLANTELKINYRGNTLDTISKAQLQIAKDKKRHQRTFAAPPLYVNKSSAVYNNLLFVNSAIPGKYEDDRVWKSASIIDIYDLEKRSYVLSFYVYNINGKKMKSFAVQNDKLYVLLGDYIIQYHLDSQITSNYNNSVTNNLLAK